jgi:hypothetical protein
LAYPANMLMRFLRADPDYVRLCAVQECYRARLTPKPWRCGDGPNHVCELVCGSDSGFVHPDLTEQLAVHDELTLPTFGSTRFEYGEFDSFIA